MRFANEEHTLTFIPDPQLPTFRGYRCLSLGSRASPWGLSCLPGDVQDNGGVCLARGMRALPLGLNSPG